MTKPKWQAYLRGAMLNLSEPDRLSNALDINNKKLTKYYWESLESEKPFDYSLDLRSDFDPPQAKIAIRNAESSSWYKHGLQRDEISVLSGKSKAYVEFYLHSTWDSQVHISSITPSGSAEPVWKREPMQVEFKESLLASLPGSEHPEPTPEQAGRIARARFEPGKYTLTMVDGDGYQEFSFTVTKPTWSSWLWSFWS